MLRAIGIIIASVSVLLMTFVILVSAQNITKDISSAWNISEWNVTASQNGTNTTETKPSQSLTLEGLSPQGGNTVAIGCTYFLQHC
jgi:hypothetical protein